MTEVRSLVSVSVLAANQIVKSCPHLGHGARSSSMGSMFVFFELSLMPYISPDTQASGLNQICLLFDLDVV